MTAKSTGGPKLLLFFILSVFLGVDHPGSAEPQTIPFRVVPYDDPTVRLEGLDAASVNVGVSDGAWIILRFGKYDLGNNILILESLDDPKQRQVFTQEKLARWDGGTARFVGNMVNVTIFGNDITGDPTGSLIFLWENMLDQGLRKHSEKKTIGRHLMMTE